MGIGFADFNAVFGGRGRKTIGLIDTVKRGDHSPEGFVVGSVHRPPRRGSNPVGIPEVHHHLAKVAFGEAQGMPTRRTYGEVLNAVTVVVARVKSETKM